MSAKIATTENRVIKASARYLRIAPRKMRLLTNLVKNMYVDQAIVNLNHAPQKGSEFLIRAIKSAAANAVNNFSIKAEDLFVKSLTCDMGPVLKRSFPRARGSAFVIRRKMSHVNVELVERKRGGKAASRLELFKKKQAEEKTESSMDKKDATEIKPESQKVVQRKVKTDEQVKMNKVQNKRRLFNRKSGE